MPRYFFDLHNGSGLHRDQIGDELDDFEQAREQCQTLLPDIVRDELPDGELHTVTCTVRDETDRIVYRGEITYKGTRDPT